MEDWLGHAPVSDRLDQANSAVFVCRLTNNDGSWYSCRLCSRDSDLLIWRNSLQRHAEETLHKQRAEAVIKERDAMRDRAVQTLRFVEDTKRFLSNDLEASIGRYVLFGPSTITTLDDLERRTTNLRLSDPLVQLELALWKAACELRPPDDLIRPGQWKAWYQGGWKSNKAQSRKDPLMNIPALVAPFLGLKKAAE